MRLLQLFDLFLSMVAGTNFRQTWTKTDTNTSLPIRVQPFWPRLRRICQIHHACMSKVRYVLVFFCSGSSRQNPFLGFLTKGIVYAVAVVRPRRENV